RLERMGLNVLRRGCLIGCGGLLVICLVVAGLGYFIGLPRAQDAIANDIGDGIATVVADGIQGANPSTGQLTITEQQINNTLNSDVNNANMTAQIDQSGVAIEFSVRNDNSNPIRYSAVPTIDENGHLQLT